MQAPSQDLFDAALAVEIASPTAFTLRGDPYAVPGATSGPALVLALQNALYGFYCRGPAAVDPRRARPSDPATVRRFAAALSQANTGRGTRDPGWTVVEIDDDGRVVVHKDGISIWAAPCDFEPIGGETRPGVRGRLRTGKELCAMMPGFYFAIGDGLAPEEDDPALPLVRYYWHVEAEGAAPLVRAISSALNGEGVPFRFKTLTDPQGYRRADAAVLYLGWEAHLRAAPLVAAARAAVAPFLHAEVPRFTKAVAPGVGVAEDPRAEGLSFGQHRCRVVAEGLWTAFAKQRTAAADRVEEVASAFVRHGLDPARPYLGAGSRRDYALGAAGSAS